MDSPFGSFGWNLSASVQDNPKLANQVILLAKIDGGGSCWNRQTVSAENYVLAYNSLSQIVKKMQLS